MKKYLFFSLLFAFGILTTFSTYPEPLFEKEYNTKSIPETRIIRYRIVSHEKETEAYALSFTGKVIQGQITVQIEDNQKNVIDKKEIPAFSLVHWHFILSSEVGLNNIYIALHLKNAIGNVHSVVAPAIQPHHIYIMKHITVVSTLALLFIVLFIVYKRKLPISWLIWGILLGVLARLIFYICDYFDFLPTTIFISTTNVEEDISDYAFSAYIAVRETAVLFLLLGIFASKLLSIQEKTKALLSVSIGITISFLMASVFSGILEAVQFYPYISISPYVLALSSVQASYTPWFYLYPSMRTIVTCWLWFVSFYFVLSGAINADKKAVLQGILIFIFTQTVNVFFEQSSFICRFSSWWCLVALLIISFFPTMLFVFNLFNTRENYSNTII
ncbi:MAG TPA: hypothetical protein PLT82_08050 [Candidatus Hydrogenedens sp.]|nr:hypothetical protein [Candidatus Hydrogenedens sp.]HPP59068.1 hypothetical protein [Candidatus Hydrogenedens sp.]